MKIQFIIAGILVSLTGCEQTRSFMHMDSNSGSPFMGFQLSVDAGKSETANQRISSVAAQSPADVDAESLVTANLTTSDRTTVGFVATSKTRTPSGDLKYSLPTVDLARSPDAAAEVDDIMTRI